MMKVEEAASASAGARRSLPLRVRAQVVHGLVAFKGARSVLLSCPGGLSSLLLFPAALRFLEAHRRPHGVGRSRKVMIVCLFVQRACRPISIYNKLLNDTLAKGK